MSKRDASEGTLEYFEYPANVLTADAAKARAQVRLEQLARFRRAAAGKSQCVRVQPGRTLAVEGATDSWANGRYLVTRVEHSWEAHRFRISKGEAKDSRPGDTEPHGYENRVHMVPAGAPFRPGVPSPPRRIEGLTTAVTTGPRGEEIHVDDLGRVKLRFFWDRSGINDDRSSAWTRCMQMPMGGSMLLPRVGWEVPVAFFDGHPDRPVVLGRVYNATAIVPYGLPAAAATTSFQSATSPGGGSTNEIRMGDGAGGQELFLHASRDQSVSVGGSASTKVGANETHDVGLSYALTVDGSQTHAVAASQSVNVATDFNVGVKGGRAESIGGAELVDVTANRYVSTGAYSELIGATYALQCNQSNTVVSGGYLQAIGASLGLASGLGTSESVAAARAEVVGGSRSILAGKSYSENITGLKSTTAGAADMKAGGKVVTVATGAGKVSVGGTAKFTAGGDLILDAPQITIEVGGSLNAKALTLSGGSLKAKDGTTSIKGTIKRKGGAKIG